MKLLMKKIFSWGLMLAATFTLTNCAKEIDQPIQDIPEAEGIPFEIVASPSADTKTSNDGMSTKWVSGDAINVFYAAEGTGTFVNGGEFSITDVESNKFTGTLATSETVVLEDEENYDWYFFYPYTSYVKTPDNTSNGYVTVGGISQTQNGNDSKAHLSGKACPLYGIANGVTYPETPSATMKHLTSVVAVEVTNSTSDPLIVSSVTFTGTEDIVGTYYIDFYKNNVTDPDVTYKSSGSSYVSSKATLTVADGEAIPAGSSAVFYIAIKPFKAEAGDELTIAVNGGKKTVAMPGDVVFTAGKIKNVKFDFDESLKAPAIPLPWSEDFSGEDPLSLYTTSNVTIYEQALAEGTSPEILIGKNGGYLETRILNDSYAGILTFSCKSNYPERVELSTDNDKVVISDPVRSGKNMTSVITVPEGVASFSLRITNTNTSSNVRVDNISLNKGSIQVQELSFEESAYEFIEGSDELKAFTGQKVIGAKTTVTYSSSNSSVATVDPSTGVVTVKGIGTAQITAVAASSSDYLEAKASYNLTILAANSASEYNYTFTAKTFAANGTMDLGNLSWTLTGDGEYWGWDSNNGKGQQLGSSKKPYKTMTLSTSDFTDKVGSITLNTSGASDIEATLKVTVGGTVYGETVTLTSTATEYTFEAPQSGAVSGEIVFTWTQTSSKALYLKSISITKAN